MGTGFNALNFNTQGLSQVNIKNLNTATNQGFINAPVSKPATAYSNPGMANEVKFEVPKDTFTIGGKEIKKKTFIMAAIASALAIGGIATGIFFAIKKHKMPDFNPIATPALRPKKIPDDAIVLDSMPEEIKSFSKIAKKAIGKAEATAKDAKKTKQEVIDLTDEVKRMISEIQELFDTKASVTKDGRKVEIFTNAKGETIIKEFAEDGKKITRTSTFGADKPEIEVFIPIRRGKHSKIRVDKAREITLYRQGIERFNDKLTYECELELYKGKPAFYASGCTDFGKKEYIYKKAVDFDDGKMQSYWEDYKNNGSIRIFGKKLDFNPRGTIKVPKRDSSGKIIKNKNGKAVTREIQTEVLTEYMENLTKYADGRETSPVSIAFMSRPGSPGKHYIQGFEKSAEGKTRCKKSISYDRFKNLPVEYEENTQFGVGKWDKYFKFEGGTWYQIPPES